MPEIIKAAIIGDEPLFRLLENTEFDRLRKDEELLRGVVESAIRVKAAIVAADEREGGRAAQTQSRAYDCARDRENGTRNKSWRSGCDRVGYMASVAERMGVLGKGDARTHSVGSRPLRL